MIDLSNLTYAPGSKKNRKRVGRGHGNGRGRTCGRGTKGQNARTGHKNFPGFEGGQMPLYRRLPKRGFKNINRIEYTILNVKDLEHFARDGVINPEILLEKGVLKKTKPLLKILGEGEIRTALKVSAHKFSKSAIEKIQSAGGSVEII